ncbi:MAG: TetR/AcrR family transcriptional regulator [Campylobacteraceae bacterium]|nr:TetR/AcrR family transcriptional regulator [Campylobacteraceae bacterium]
MNSKEKLLQISFEEIYEHGYNATSIESILKKAKMNKGSMYYYFKSKKDLTLTMIAQNLSSYIQDKYSKLLDYETNILDELIKLLKDKNNFEVSHGCKVNNLVQELSHTDNDFKIALEKVYLNFENIFEQILNKAYENGEFEHNDIKSLAIFVLASFEGCLATGKKSQNKDVYCICIKQLEEYLNLLRK